ncbi:MAG: exosortase N [Bacteroidota bacterium]
MIIEYFKNFTKKQITTLVLLFAYLITGFFLLKNFIIVDVNVFLGLAITPYVIDFEKGAYSQKYLVPTVLLLILSFYIQIYTLVFLIVLFGIIYLLESRIGKVSYLFFFLLIILSPIFKFLSNSIGFPIRLWLSEVTGNLLLFTGKKVETIGNIIIIDGFEFSVDPACAGLKMMAISFIISIFLIAYFQNKIKSRISFFQVSIILIFTFILNVICNLFRIISLIIFKILPDNPLHDFVGIVCLLLYVILPLFFVIKLILKFSKYEPSAKPEQNKISRLNILYNSIIICSLLFSSFKIQNSNSTTIITNIITIDGFKKEILKTGITKFENNNALIYLKPLQFYNAEHNPMLCWTGSGYEFSTINKIKISGIDVYTGVMKKGNDKIYTAWWFDNGTTKTISQIEWRWVSAKENSLCYLINVSASSQKNLIIQTENLLKQQIIK